MNLDHKHMLYKRVRKLILSRVQAAVDSGKTLTHAALYVSPAGACCAIGAFAINGDPVPTEAVRSRECYGITAPLLMEAGVYTPEIGYILDALEFGYEGATAAAFMETGFDSNKAFHLHLLNNYAPYIALGREIDKRFGPDSGATSDSGDSLMRRVKTVRGV